MRTALLAAAAVAARAAAPEDAVLRPGAALFDTDGNRLYAGGANIWAENGTFYLVGEGRKTLSGVCSECLNLYSSQDLAAWTFEACVLRNEDVVAPVAKPGNWRMERPKIFRCPANNEWRMWFHCDTPVRLPAALTPRGAHAHRPTADDYARGARAQPIPRRVTT